MVAPYICAAITTKVGQIKTITDNAAPGYRTFAVQLRLGLIAKKQNIHFSA